MDEWSKQGTESQLGVSQHQEPHRLGKNILLASELEKLVNWRRGVLNFLDNRALIIGMEKPGDVQNFTHRDVFWWPDVQ